MIIIIRVFIENENRTSACSQGGQSHNVKKRLSLEYCYTMRTLSRMIRNTIKLQNTQSRCVDKKPAEKNQRRGGVHVEEK